MDVGNAAPISLVRRALHGGWQIGNVRIVCEGRTSRVPSADGDIKSTRGTKVNYHRVPILWGSIPMRHANNQGHTPSYADRELAAMLVNGPNFQTGPLPGCFSEQTLR
jgi:hypothetical protein